MTNPNRRVTLLLVPKKGKWTRIKDMDPVLANAAAHEAFRVGGYRKVEVQEQDEHTTGAGEGGTGAGEGGEGEP